MELTEHLAVHGRLALTVVGPDGTVRSRRQGDNVMCTSGLSAIATALVTAGLRDRAGDLGLSTLTDLTPLWGAVGDGAGTPAAADTALLSELGRQPVGAGASTPAAPAISALATWLFYFPPPPVNWTVTEAGVFALATSTAGAGTMLDHWAFAPSVSVPTTDTLIFEASFSIGGGP